jgi:toxin ParE1/3/4
MGRAYRRSAARRDLIRHFVYLAEQATDTSADRFLAEAEASFIELADQPGMGAPVTLDRRTLPGLRKWRINQFDRDLILYLPPRRPNSGAFSDRRTCYEPSVCRDPALSVGAPPGLRAQRQAPAHHLRL